VIGSESNIKEWGKKRVPSSIMIESLVVVVHKFLVPTISTVFFTRLIIGTPFLLEGAHPVRDGQVKIIRVRVIVYFYYFWSKCAARSS
jgi:hypothetical protein